MESHHIAFFRYFIAVPVLLAVILAMGACAQLSVPAKHEVESVLLIAKLNKNTSFDSWMRRYALELESLDVPGQRQEIWLDNNRQPFVVTGALAPGDYRLTRLTWLTPTAWGGESERASGHAIDLHFRLNTGTLTLLPLDFLLFQEEHESTTRSRFDLSTMTPARAEAAQAQAMSLAGAEQWSLALAAVY